MARTVIFQKLLAFLVPFITGKLRSLISFEVWLRGGVLLEIVLS